jgi:tetrapyrrole methylase family protein / MazG family protein
MKDLKDRVYDPALTPFERLTVLMDILRSPQGCAWDRKQTHQSLLPYLIEETYEVVEVIESGRLSELAEELGDLLTQIVFHAQLANERGEFEINDAVNTVVDKLVNRHPHVFGERKDLKTSGGPRPMGKIKTSSAKKTLSSAASRAPCPALTAAFRLGEKAGGVGFDWNRPPMFWKKSTRNRRGKRGHVPIGYTRPRGLNR